MKTTDTLIKQAIKTAKQQQQTPSETRPVANPSVQNSMKLSLVNDLFKVMQMRKPHLIISAYPSPKDIEDAKMEYMHQWQGITPSMIKNGIHKLKNRYPLKFLPDPVEFVYEFCFPTPEELGLPTELKAWTEANDHAHEPTNWRWSHRSVYLAARVTGWFELRNQNSAESIRATRKKFNEEYQALVSTLAQDKELEPVKSLEYINDPKARSDQALKTTMEDQGINPKGGRAEFMKRFRGLLK